MTYVFVAHISYDMSKWCNTYHVLSIHLFSYQQTTVDPITSTNWYRVLSEYGTTNSNNADSNDRKSIIIGKVIDKILIPKINRLTEVYKPYNPDVANRAIGLTDLIKSIV